MSLKTFCGHVTVRVLLSRNGVRFAFNISSAACDCPSVGGSLVDVSVMSAAALFLAIPFSFFWGYISDKTRRYKRYILLSFLASTILLYLFTLTTNVALLILLYVVMSILHIAHEAPKNVLIAELYSHQEWEGTLAFYESLTEVGWLIGLLLGFLSSAFGFVAANTDSLQHPESDGLHSVNDADDRSPSHI